MQNLTADPAALAPMARLMSVGDVLVQNDLAYELYDRPPPQLFWQSLHLPLVGLSAPVGYGTPTTQRLAHPGGRRVDPGGLAQPAVARRRSRSSGCSNPRPIVRAESTSGALVVAGDAVGLNDAAGLGPARHDLAGALRGHRSTPTPRALASALGGGATLVVTDSNRKQSFLWNTVSNNAGITLAASDPETQRGARYLPRRARRAPSPRRSTAACRRSPGSPTTPTTPPTWRSTAFPTTAWQTHLGSSALGKFWQVTLANQVTTGQVTDPPAPRRRLPGQPVDHEGHAQLRRRRRRSPSSWAPRHTPVRGQVVTFPRRTFTTLRITVTPPT